MGSHSGTSGERLALALPPAGAVVLSNYAGLPKEQNKYGEAAQLYCLAIEIFEARVGPESEAVGRTLMELGALYVEAGRRRAAVEPLTRAMVVLSSALGAEHTSVAATMAWLGRCRGPDEEAEALEFPPGCPVERLLAKSKS